MPFVMMKPILLAAALAVMSQTPSTFAQAKLDFEPGDAVRAVIERNAGQVLELRLKSGEKIGGKVEKVGEKMVHLSQLSGAEFFDAVVALDDVSAVVIRTKGR
jgi:hypothetical protein